MAEIALLIKSYQDDFEYEPSDYRQLFSSSLQFWVGWAFLPVAGLSDKSVQPTFLGLTKHLQFRPQRTGV